ncbi:4-hydroxy-2-oxovalerate aldolase [Geomonas limicola]|uniref:4-hydroxy-2-oxovalerate aldolase n=1 Tax=Geomonas limicola TaxID=2740186 RepID=A0A6V8NED3_9BACT|nr:4-hydroxy-2-oxovalerate aldolase [Geomonas limicola]GFO70137.1 4-hydroxy-2-oxovalerate aldolase [Geomonas limicola]
MKNVIISDATLRDGSHAIAHQLTKENIAEYAKAADKAGIPIVEVGHGNGLGASSVQVGLSLLSDVEMLETARENLTRSKLGIHVIPGFATVRKDLEVAFKLGVDVVRVASHCTEADVTERHISATREHGKEAYGVLMMSHMASKEVLLDEGLKMQSYGAEALIIMDSAGAYLPDDVEDRISHLVANLNIPVGFHAHNNLGMGIANSLTALKAGAQLLDGAARGFGAGAGNAQLEVLVAVLEKMGYHTGIELYPLLDAADLVEKKIMKVVPSISSSSLVSGLAGVFSAFSKHVAAAAKEYGVDPRDIFFELGRRRVVGGQEDKIVEVAMELRDGKVRGAHAE